MLYLSIALVLIFALYLIDKHNAWKGAVKIVTVGAVLYSRILKGRYPCHGDDLLSQLQQTDGI